MKAIMVQFEIANEVQALALAQFVKRVGFSDCERNAVDEEEAYEMIRAFAALQRGLAEAGFAPR